MKLSLVPEQHHFPVAGIAVAPGESKALQRFFRTITPDSGMAFLVMSCSNDEEAHISVKRLHHQTSMPIIVVDRSTPLQQNSIHICPPGSQLLQKGTTHAIRIDTREKTPEQAYDDFFCSLAKSHGNKAACILLPADHVGVHGVEAISKKGGCILIQESPKTGSQEIKSALVEMSDAILPPDSMAQHLLRHMRRLETISRENQLQITGDWTKVIDEIIELLRIETSHDFTLYKLNTIYRRIERRMDVLRLAEPTHYLDLLKSSKNEISILFHDLLIGVTSFFRDPEAFSALEQQFLPPLLLKKKQGDSFRAWIPGCSSGEEAYTIAMLLMECMERLGVHLDVQIFATDLDERAITKARSGRYPESIAMAMSSERLARFFKRHDDGYQVVKSLRENVIFAQQNLIKDPPFTRLDLLCCRNLLIYFSTTLQKRLMPLFHYALNPSGILFIGTFETIGTFHDLFLPLDAHAKIFSKMVHDTPQRPFPLFPPTSHHTEMDSKHQNKVDSKQRIPSSAKILKTILTKSEISSCLVIDERGDILYIHGHTGRYLEPAEGKATLNVLKMARPGIRAGLSKAYRLALEEGIESRSEGFCSWEDNSSVVVDIQVTPLVDSELGRGMMLIIFNAVETTEVQNTARGKESLDNDKADSTKIRQLKEQLKATQRSLQSTIEELESSNEELRSTNEELQSTNEELQSTNEELETSREELQSSNEESTAVNNELQKSINQLVAANEDIQHMLDVTSLAAVFLDSQLKIKRFTSKATELFPFTDSDIGRPITNFSSKLKNVDLEHYASIVLKDLGMKTVEVSDGNSTIYRMRLRPFRKSPATIDGLVITFEDISETKELMEKGARLDALLKDSEDAITLLDLDGNILSWNRGAEKLYGYSEKEARTMNTRDLIPPEKRDAFNRLYRQLRHEDVTQVTLERLHREGHLVKVYLTVTRLTDNVGNVRHLSSIEKVAPASAETDQNIT